MKIIFLGIMFCEESLKNAYAESKCGISMAPHVFQTNLLKGFNHINDLDISVINIPPIGSFPINNRRIYSKEYFWDNKNHQIGFFNLPKLKNVLQKNRIKKELLKIIKKEEKLSDLKILAYSVYEPFLDVLCFIKNKYPEIPLCLIQTDPIMGRGERAKYMTKSAIKEGNRIVKKAKCVDKFVLLTKYLSETIETESRPFEIIECVCDSNQEEAKIGMQRNICLYTGTLNEEFGIKELVDAFEYIHNAELWICGNGNTKDYILKKVSLSKNIKFFGYLDKTEIREMQNKCDFLINPRRPSGTYTKYSFPSKTAEYMMTGKPVIMYKLEGVPDEYDDYLNYLTESDPKLMANELINIFASSYDTLLCKAQKGRSFMIKEKSSDIQAAKIFTFIKEDY